MSRETLLALFERAIAAADPEEAVRRNLPEPPAGRTVVVGAGKAAARMARALEAAWPSPLEGVVVTRYGAAVPCERIAILEAAHPVPDGAGVAASQRLMATVGGLGSDDLVIALISGGGSALLAAPGPGMTLADEQAVNAALLASGAPIGAMNRIRRELSRIKAGRLAALASPARVVTLVLSDVPGDDPALVASGPTIPSASSRAEARELVCLYGLNLPPAALRLLDGEENPAPDPADPRFARNEVRLVASAALSLEAAAEEAHRRGYAPAILSDAVEGEARDIGRMHAAIALEITRRDRPFRRPAALLSGGETTVTLRGRGKGGRNSEFLLAFALAVDGVEGISALAADTDGIDGVGDNAGAVADGTSAGRMRAAGMDPAASLAANDAYTAFAAIGDLVTTGPTGTNVNDFRVVLVE